MKKIRSFTKILIGVLPLVILFFACSKNDNPAPAQLKASKPVVYVSGLIKTAAANKVLAYWTDTVTTTVTDGSYFAKSEKLVVSGTDVYNVGAIKDGTNVLPVYWKNKDQVALATNGSTNGAAHSIKVSGTDVYAAGSLVLNNKYQPVIWKNTVAQILAVGTDYGYDCQVNDIAFVGADVYAVGYADVDYVTANKFPILWKNGVASNLTLPSGALSALANFIAISGNDVYVLGEAKMSVTGDVLPVLWKNAEVPVVKTSSKIIGQKLIYPAALSIDDKNNVYVFANGLQGGTTSPVILFSWKNDAETTTSFDSQVVRYLDAFISTSDIYAVFDNKVVSKNGVALTKFDGTNVKLYPNHVFVSLQ